MFFNRTQCCDFVAPQWDAKKSGEFACRCGKTHTVTAIYSATLGGHKILRSFFVTPKSEISWLEKFQMGITCDPRLSNSN